MKPQCNVIVILGPTASGKTAVAARLASLINGEIISADSRQVYRHLNLGTGKDYNDYILDGKQIPYHLIDIVDPGTQYNVYEYQKNFVPVFEDITNREKVSILCGGSGLYIEAVIQGYRLIHVPINQPLRDEMEQKSLEQLITILAAYKNIHNNSDIENKKRVIRAIEIEEYYVHNPQIDLTYPEMHPVLFGVRFDRATERIRITERLKQRLKDGMVEEVEQLLKQGITPEQLIYYGLEYKFLTRYLIGEITYDEMFTQLNTAIHQFSKRQMTWFRRMEQQGMKIHWISGGIPMEEKMERIIKVIGKG
jgi:tRNA dimethylallyltransferase